jgi:predicted glycosyltransferase
MLVGMIRDLERRGLHVTVTSRPLANTIHLLRLYGIESAVIGEHQGASLVKKAVGYPLRSFQLFQYLNRTGVDVAVSQSSFYSPPVARLLGARSIYMNDNEHALGNVPAFVCADRIFVPECMDPAILRRQLAAASKVVRYPGVKEGLYLWEMAERIRRAAEARPPRLQQTLYVRPEPWTAQYYSGQTNFLDNLLLAARERLAVTVLARGEAQGRHYRESRFAGIRVVDTALDVEDIAVDCDVFVGAGGTMTREMAVLGVPTISVYQSALLDVDRYLLAHRAFVHDPGLTAATLFQFLEQSVRQPPNVELLQKGRAAYEMIIGEVLNG